MSLAYRDFLPWAPGAYGPGAVTEWEPLPMVVGRVNQWLTAGGLRAVSLETLLLPAAKRVPLNSNAGALLERCDEDYAWVQVVRVWYEVPPVAPILTESTPAQAPMSPTLPEIPTALDEQKYQPPA